MVRCTSQALHPVFRASHASAPSPHRDRHAPLTSCTHSTSTELDIEQSVVTWSRKLTCPTSFRSSHLRAVKLFFLFTQRARTRFLSTTSNLPSKLRSSAPILSFLKDLVSTSHWQSQTTASTPLLHPLDVFVSFLHTSSFHDQLSRRMSTPGCPHFTGLFFAAKLKRSPITLLVSAPHTLFSYFKTFPAIPANSLSRSSMEAVMSSTKPSTSAQNRTEKQTDPVGTCESHRPSLLCTYFLLWCSINAVLTWPFLSPWSLSLYIVRISTPLSHSESIRACWPVTALSLSAEPKVAAMV